MVNIGIDSYSIFVPSPFHPLDNTVVGITRLDISKKVVTKIEVNIFLILLSYTKFLFFSFVTINIFKIFLSKSNIAPQQTQNQDP
jgi:hypothetical protein